VVEPQDYISLSSDSCSCSCWSLCSVVAASTAALIHDAVVVAASQALLAGMGPLIPI